MNKKPKFISIAELAYNDGTVSELAIAIEKNGFYTWDRYGRFSHIKNDIKPNEKSDSHEVVYKKVLDDLAKGLTHDGVDYDYFYKEMMTPSLLGESGWNEEKLPDFKQLIAEWSEHNGGVLHQEKPKFPSKQNKVWLVLEGLVKLKFGDDVLDDLKSVHSMHTSTVRIALETKGVDIDAKTLKSYFKHNQT